MKNFIPTLAGVTTIAIGTALASAAELSKDAAEKAIASEFSELAKADPAPGLVNKLSEVLTKPADTTKPNPRVKLNVKELPIDDKSMPYAVILRESEPKPTKRALFISMHGGGQSAKQPGPHTWEVNTREFRTQIQFALSLYQPDGIYFIPRMADDRVGRWWHKHNQIAFDRVIDHAILHWNVDPNRVYIMGVSEGGYGTDILAPFMADRFAGANAMAAGVGLGNPPANLRNLPFRTDVGANDTMFDRKPMAVAYHKELDRLRELDPSGYENSINAQAGRGHGIDYSQGIKWISKFSRNPWPEKITWINQPMDGVRRERFYWIAMPEAPPQVDIRIDAIADKSTNTITIDLATLEATNTDGNRSHGKDNVAEAERTPLSGAKLKLLLRDALVDLDKPVTVICNGEQVFKGTIDRTTAIIDEELAKRGDPAACPTARLSINTP